MGVKVRFINYVAIFLFTMWTLLMSSVAGVFIYENYKYADYLAKQEAAVGIKKDFAFRHWGASHGGVYVPITKKTPPNPYLSHIPNRDINTSANVNMTLMNPAYMLSQMMKDYSEYYNVKGHITSRMLLNPKNEPDSWEYKALEVIEVTKKPFFEKTIIGDNKYFRYMNPMITKQECLKCHAHQGYKVGDVRGGVSVSIPMKPFYKKALSQSFINVLVIFIIYIIGIISIIFGRKKAKQVIEDKIQDYEQHIFSLVNIIETRDRYTAGHTQRVAKYSVLIAEYMGFNEEKVDDLYRACMLHDIGKISTPDSILLKPGRLTDLEYKIIQNHVVASYELLKGVDIYKEIAEIVRHHHERCDGSGYPQGLTCEQIPFLTQIMSVADAFDAMTTNRIYKPKKSIEEALAELDLLAGTQFSTEVVKVAKIVLKDIEIKESISQAPRSKIEKERFSYFYKDQVTTVYNKQYLDFLFIDSKKTYRCLNVFYLNNFTSYNKNHSWEQGNEMLKKVAQTIDNYHKSSVTFRINGDDFILLSKSHIEVDELLDKLQEILKDTEVKFTHQHCDSEKLCLDEINKFVDIV